LKNRIENISSLIESYCKKKLVFARPLLPFGTVGEAHAQIAHLVFADTHNPTQKNQKSNFLSTLEQETISLLSFKKIRN
jgi:hypothetical protein